MEDYYSVKQTGSTTHDWARQRYKWHGQTWPPGYHNIRTFKTIISILKRDSSKLRPLEKLCISMVGLRGGDPILRKCIRTHCAVAKTVENVDSRLFRTLLPTFIVNVLTSAASRLVYALWSLGSSTVGWQRQQRSQTASPTCRFGQPVASSIRCKASLTVAPSGSSRYPHVGACAMFANNVAVFPAAVLP